MSKSFEKNRLDLAYQKQLHYLNGVIALGTIGILSFIGTFIWNKENLKIGVIIVTTILIIDYLWYKNIDNSLKEISLKIKALN
ncbi:hypothetical protein J4463_02975 [Candidatus Pacearchaeota archaeon]|nr:hypothetical protein [uncultured archaeon]MBS3100154.1 hypothetical protein [Candidatus Pacearchaeota archaeon]